MSFLNFAKWKRPRVHENFISCSLKKNVIWGNLIFLGHFLLFVLTWSKITPAFIATGSFKSHGMISFMITTGSIGSQEIIRIHKQSRHDFCGKDLCDGHFKGIIWCLYVEVSIQWRVEWFCGKGPFRVCCVILF